MKRCRLRAGGLALSPWRATWRLCLGLVCLGLACPAGAVEPPLTLLVFDRPPYYVLDHGQPAGGILLNISLAVFEQAGIAVAVREMPPGRILATLESREVRACAVGWLRTPEREAHARFSLPLYEDQPLGVVIHPDKARQLAASPSLAELAAADLTWGMRQGFSYGQTMDAVFAQVPGTRIRHFPDTRAMLHLVARGRLDAIPIGPEELSVHLDAEPALAQGLRFLTISDAPAGIVRHLMCGQAVSPAVMARLDAAIMAVRDSARYRQLIRLRAGH